MPQESEQDGQDGEGCSHGGENNADLQSLIPGDQVRGQLTEHFLQLARAHG